MVRFIIPTLSSRFAVGSNTFFERRELLMIARVLGLTCLILLVSTAGMAQDVPKVEVFGGYSWAGGNFHGWNTSVTGNINNWFGLVADFSGHYGSEQEGTILVDKDAH